MAKSAPGISRMNLEHLKTFHVVASLGKFYRSRQSFIPRSQPAVSQQIQGPPNTLLKNPLFDRGKRQIRLTARGKILFNHTQRLFGIFKEIESVFNAIRSNQLQTGELTIAAVRSRSSSYFLPDTSSLEFSSKTYPLTNIRLEMGDSGLPCHGIGGERCGWIWLYHGMRKRPQKPRISGTFVQKSFTYVCVCSPTFPLCS